MTYNRMHTFQNVYFVPIDYSNSKFQPKFKSEKAKNETVDLIYCRNGKINVLTATDGPNSKKIKHETELCSKQFVIMDAGVSYSFEVTSEIPATALIIRWQLVPSKEYEYSASSLISVDVRGFFDKLEGLKRFTYNADSFLSALDFGNLENSLIRYLHGLAGNQAQDVSKEVNDLTNFLQVLLELDKSLLPSSTTTGIIYIKKAQDYIKNHFNQDVKVEDVAQAAGINKAYLQRLFKSHVGMSVIQSLNNYRIDKCKQLLIDTNLTVNEICVRAGFNNRQHLIYEFKIQTKKTPSQFRDEYINKNFLK